MICGWLCYRSFFFFLLCLPFLVVFRLFVFFFLRKWVGGFNFNGFFFLSLSPSLSVCISLSVSLSVCVCVRAQCVCVCVLSEEKA